MTKWLEGNKGVRTNYYFYVGVSLELLSTIITVVYVGSDEGRFSRA